MNHLTASQIADRAVVNAEQALHAASSRAKNDRSAQAQEELAAAEHARRVAIARADDATRAEERLNLADATRAAAQADASFAARAHAEASEAAVFALSYGYDHAPELAVIAHEAFAASEQAERRLAVADRQYRDALAAYVLAIVGAA